MILVGLIGVGKVFESTVSKRSQILRAENQSGPLLFISSAFITSLLTWVVHLEDEGAILQTNQASVDSQTVVTGAPVVTLKPLVVIQAVKVALPALLEMTSLLVILLDFDIQKSIFLVNSDKFPFVRKISQSQHLQRQKDQLNNHNLILSIQSYIKLDTIQKNSQEKRTNGKYKDEGGHVQDLGQGLQCTRPRRIRGDALAGEES